MRDRPSRLSTSLEPLNLSTASLDSTSDGPLINAAGRTGIKSSASFRTLSSSSPLRDSVTKSKEDLYASAGDISSGQGAFRPRGPSPPLLKMSLNGIDRLGRSDSMMESPVALSNTVAGHHLRFFRKHDHSQVSGGRNGTISKNAIGSTIPSVEDYDCMLKQFEKLLVEMPDGVRESVLLQRDPPNLHSSSADLADLL